MKCKEIQHLSAEFPVSRLCATLAVRESSYYAWLRREPIARAIENTMLLKQIKDLWHHFRGIYGAPRRFICWNEKNQHHRHWFISDHEK